MLANGSEMIAGDLNTFTVEIVLRTIFQVQKTTIYKINASKKVTLYLLQLNLQVTNKHNDIGRILPTNWFCCIVATHVLCLY